MSNTLRIACVFLVTIIDIVHGVTARARVCNKAVNFGVTFYTASELSTILECIEPTAYDTPTNTSAIISAAKECVISNSASKMVSALSLYSDFTSCISPDTLTTVMDAVEDPFFTSIKGLKKKAIKVVTNCKNNSKLTGTAKQNACVNKVYNKCMGAVTKKYVNRVCKVVYNAVDSVTWTCGKKYAPQVINVTGWNCYSLTK